MLAHTIKNVYIAQHKLDFRKRLGGLLAEAKFMGLDTYAGDCLVFIHPSREKIRILGGNSYGAWILDRFFEGGKLEQKFEFLLNPAFVEVTYAELSMLLDGTDFIIKKRAKKWRKNINKNIYE